MDTDILCRQRQEQAGHRHAAVSRLRYVLGSVRRRSTPIQTRRAAPSAAITAKICADVYEILLAPQGNISLSWGRQIGSQSELSGCVNSLLRSQERDGASKYLFFSRALMQVPISFRGNLPYKQHLELKKNPIWFLAKSQSMCLPSSPRGTGLNGHGPWRVSDKANNLCRFVWKNQSKPNHLSLSLTSLCIVCSPLTTPLRHQE